MTSSKYIAPQIAYPSHWQLAPSPDKCVPFNWHDFHDPVLENWLQQVMSHNSDLAEALLRLNQSALGVESEAINSVPDIDSGINTASSKLLSQSSSRTKSSGVRFSTNYETDLWGRLSSQQDIAEWSRKISEQDVRTIRLSLLDVASMNYWNLGKINQQIKVIKKSVAYSEYTLRMATLRYRSGVTSIQDKVEAERNLLIQTNNLAQLEQLRLQTLNEQAILMGMPPGNGFVEPATLSLLPLPKIVSDIPAETLSCRPDVQSKEMKLRQALANIDVAHAQFYPQFNLTGSLGTSSDAMLEFLQNPIGSIGAAIAFPFLEWRQGLVQIDIARNEYEQHLLEFKQTQYIAMVEIENSLSEHRQLIAEEANQRALLAMTRHLEKLNEIRYRQGQTVMEEWLNAQEQYRQAELAVFENRFKQYQNLTKIYLAFGGAA